MKSRVRVYVSILFVAVLVALLRAADDQPDGLKLKFLSEPITLDEDNGVQHVVVEVTVPKESIQPFNITAKSGDGTTGSKAIVGEDYEEIDRNLTVTDKCIDEDRVCLIRVPVRLFDNLYTEADKTFTLTVTFEPKGVETHSEITIKDDDGPIHIDLEVPSYPAFVNQPMKFFVVKTGRFRSDISVNVMSTCEPTLVGTVVFGEGDIPTDKNTFEFNPGSDETTCQLSLDIMAPPAVTNLIDFENTVDVTVSLDYVKMFHMLQNQMAKMKEELEEKLQTDEEKLTTLEEKLQTDEEKLTTLEEKLKTDEENSKTDQSLDGNWSTSTRTNTGSGSLTVQLCPDPAVLVNGTVTLTGNPTSDTATYACNPGFELIGNSTTTCTAAVDGNSATFSPAPPVCRPMCHDPATIVNGNVIKTGNSVNDTATYKCGRGFKPLGSETRTCTQEKGNYSASFLPGPPVCKVTPPTVTIDSSPPTAKLEGPFIFTCTVTLSEKDSGKPDITWTGPNTLDALSGIIVGNITKITDVVYTRILNFTAVKSSHKGNYSCTGNSSAGNETKTEPLPIPGNKTGTSQESAGSNSYVWVVVAFIAILLAIAAAYVIYHQRTKIKACLADGEKGGAKGRKSRYKKLPTSIHDALHQD